MQIAKPDPLRAQPMPRPGAAMRQVFIAGVLCALQLTAVAATAASFDCKKASTAVEKMVCADAPLSRLDEELAETYRTAGKKRGPAEAGRLRSEQAAWLKSRDTCKDTLCIEAMYRTRLAVLAAEEKPHPSYPGRFWLTFGKGVKVCEAYLERLNRSSYRHHPKCDRPENDEVAGFQLLNRAQLGVGELEPFWPAVTTFLESGNVQDWRRGEANNQKLGVRPRFGATVEERRNNLKSESTLAVFRYDKPIDIDNDGVADPVVIWRSGNCQRFGPVFKMFFWDSIPVVLNAAGDGPDVERTRRIFGHPEGGYRVSSGELAPWFRPIGKQMGIFQFEGNFYMDAFFDEWGDFNGNSRNVRTTVQPRSTKEPEIANSLAVFLRRGNEIKQVCEYWFEDEEERKREPIFVYDSVQDALRKPTKK